MHIYTHTHVHTYNLLGSFFCAYMVLGLAILQWTPIKGTNSYKSLILLLPAVISSL